MRLWSVSPTALDAKGLVACWREALLAQKVLRGLTKGYRQHPQLERFREQADPIAAITAYLSAIADEATARGYNFDRSRIVEADPPRSLMEVTGGQLELEYHILQEKVQARDEAWYAAHLQAPEILPHPLFEVVSGPIAPWERYDPQ